MKDIINKIIEIDKKAQDLDESFKNNVVSEQKKQKEALRNLEDKYQSESVTKLNSVHDDIINSQNNNIENQKRSIGEKKNQLKKIFEENEDKLVDKFFNIITE
ncbi:hypothetical protein [uncultured Finegoldia sp.]|uniref:hypothetical protein n=1 Tax=uncultured Finegoldia sp. TaxID=328009 RepID=UPI002605F150|nr:hypothetical protein [uncultured Finegoldia sp.]